jgi:pre-mRNA cleavage complex 2 protein Pcf11
MSYGVSDEVAEDFKLALEDLTMNSRYEISNLTVIAKENTEHALAISEALKEHIKRVGKKFHTANQRTASCSYLAIRSIVSRHLCSFTYIALDRSGQETARSLPSRFYCQKRGNTIYLVLWPTTIFDFHGSLCAG